jgi:hypothetical protein
VCIYTPLLLMNYCSSYMIYHTILSSILCVLAYNLRFSTRLAKKHPNIWSFIQLTQCELVRFKHISIQLEAGASAPKQSAKTKAYQARIETLRNRYLKKEINARELLSGSSLLVGKKKNKLVLCNQFSLVFRSINKYHVSREIT